MATLEQQILDPVFLNSIGEHFLAGHVACAPESPMLKVAAGLRELFAKTSLHIDTKRNICPSGALRSGAYCPIFNGLVVHNQAALTNGLQQTYSREDASAIANVVAGYWQPYGRDGMWQGHATLDYTTLLHHGLPSYQGRVQARLRAAEEAGDQEKSELFQALSIVLCGIADLIRRYIAECDRLVAQAKATERFRLERMKASFEQMAIGAPRDFYEAMQYVHFLNAVDGFDNAGRLDQYLYPYFSQDQELGRLDAGAAEDLLVDMLDIWGSVTFWNVVIGGTGPDGADASNELTYIILRARGRVQRPNPNLSLRLSSRSSDELLMAAFGTLLKGQGQPAIYNDDLYVRTLEEIGVPRSDAAEFVFGGCSETHIAGKSSIRDGFLGVVDPLLQALGMAPGRGAGSRGAPREDPPDFQAFFEAYKRHVRSAIDEHVARRNTTQKYVAKHQPALVRSIFVSGCIEKGMSHSEGGALYNHGMIDVYGIPNVANSLYVIKELVYEDQVLSLDTLRDALTRDFSGYEDVRMLCLRQAKYGNDVDEVDSLAREASDCIFSYIQKHRLWNGDIFYGFCASAPGQHVTLGQSTGTTPDGRLAGTPLANSMGPVQGTDTSGPTAALNSVSKLDLSRAIGTPVVNLSIDRTIVLERRDAMVFLVRTFFRKGGMQLQFNVVDHVTLMNALERPGEYGDLIVRVSGYSAYFVRLTSSIQEEIVKRTIHGALPTES